MLIFWQILFWSWGIFSFVLACPKDVTTRLCEAEERLDRTEKFIQGCSCMISKPASCPEGWTEFNQSCYLYVSEPGNWLHGRKFCMKHNSDLVAIETKAENAMVAELTKKAEYEDVSCFDQWRGHIMDMVPSLALKEGTAQKCLQACKRAERVYGFQCRSVNFYSDFEDCLLFKESHETLLEKFSCDTKGDRVDYYQNNCKINPMQNHRQDPICHPVNIDVVLLIDGSGSVGESNFGLMLNFIKNLTESFEIGQSNNRLAVVQFTKNIFSEFSLNRDFKSIQDAWETIDGITYRDGLTNIAGALRHVADVELTSEHGDRPDAPNVVITLTDGISWEDPTEEANRLRSRGALTLAIGVGAEPDDVQLLGIAGAGANVFRVQDFSRLDAHLEEVLRRQICTEVPQAAPTKSGIWLGMNDRDVDGKFQWTTGAFLTSKTQFWGPDQPGDRDHTRNCVLMDPTNQLWRDSQCEELHPFVCEKPL